MAVPTIFNDPVVSQAPDYAIDQAIQSGFATIRDVPDSVQILRERDHLGRKFGPADITHDLHLIATAYTARYAGKFGFMLDMLSNHSRGRSLTASQAAAVLNCYYAELARNNAPLSAPPVKQEVVLDDDDRAYEDWLSVTSNAVGKGTYTIVSPLTGDRVTVRLGPWRQDKYNQAQKMRWISFKQGHSYTLYAKQTEGQSHRVLPRMRGADGKVNTALGVLFNDPDEVSRAALAYALESGRCARCDKQLTVPASIYAGYGPECVKHVRS